MASKRDLEKRIKYLERQIQRQILRDYYPELTLKGKVDAIERHLGIRVSLNRERTIPAEIVVTEVEKPKAAPAKRGTRAGKAKKAKK